MRLIEILYNLEYGEDIPSFNLFGVDLRCNLIKTSDGYYKSFRAYNINSLNLYLYMCAFDREEVVVDTFARREELGRYKILDLKADPSYYVLRDTFLRTDVSIGN